MSARSHVTLWAQEGGEGEDVTEDQVGAPERLFFMSKYSLIARTARGV